MFISILNRLESKTYEIASFTIIMLGAFVFACMVFLLINDLALKTSIDRAKSYIHIYDAAEQYCNLNGSCNGVSFEILITLRLLREKDIEDSKSILGGRYVISAHEDQKDYSVLPEGIHFGYAPSSITQAHNVSTMKISDITLTPSLMTFGQYSN